MFFNGPMGYCVLAFLRKWNGEWLGRLNGVADNDGRREGGIGTEFGVAKE